MARPPHHVQSVEGLEHEPVVDIPAGLDNHSVPGTFCFNNAKSEPDMRVIATTSQPKAAAVQLLKYTGPPNDQPDPSRSRVT